MVKKLVGGQALIEGVMMKHGNKLGIAIRQPNGKITVKQEKIKFKETNIPFLRGVVNLFIMLYIGVKSLNYSANVASGEEDSKASTIGIFFSILFAIIFAIALFKFLPLGFVSLLDKYFNFNNFVFNILDGLVKIALFVLYVYLVSLMKDIKRVFQYHGAEHKTVACYENKKKLVFNEVKNFKKEHPRCGTSFVFLVLFISIIVYTFIPKDYGFWLKLLLRVVLLPVVASLSYEVLRLSSKYKFFNFIAYPGILLQKITTKEPDEKQVEVAIRALKAAIN